MIAEKAGTIHITKGSKGDCSSPYDVTTEGKRDLNEKAKIMPHIKFRIPMYDGTNAKKWISRNGAVMLMMQFSGHLGLYSLKPGTCIF